MSVIIQLIALANGHASIHEGNYVKDFDPYYDPILGLGFLTSTNNITKAKRFPSNREAIEYWRQQSPTVPLRPDGKPNLPLTSFTVSIDHVE